MELFENNDFSKQPLAYRMRPRTLDEYIGQDHIIGPGRLLRRSIQADQLSSVIFYGPPGTGKTTLARVIANTTKSHFTTINAVLAGVKDLRDEIEEAKNRLEMYDRRTILFVDEVHRWNKSQQDALLPWVENGTFILIGATTENPFFEVNPALVSRSRIFQLKHLTNDDLYKIAQQALHDKERGYGNFEVSFEEGALEHLVDVASGDARSLLNAIELAVETTEHEGKKIFISKQAAEESIQRKAVLYDKEGDYHFDVISAFIKSIRGSDPDASLYWLAKMVHAGEDPRFIFRRMMISACEDVGLADPNAIVVVQSDAQAFNMIGMPEGRYHLAHACLYLATAPKSNSEMGFFDALKVVEDEEANAEVPNHLRDNSRDSKGFGHGQGYMYPHAYKDHWVAQQYLPGELQGKIFYQPGEIGYEKTIKDEVNRKREIQLESVDINAFPENLTYSPDDKSKELWLRRTSEGTTFALEQIRNKIFDRIETTRSDRILVLNAGHGLLVWEALRKTPEGLVVAQINRAEDRQYIEHFCIELKDVEKPVIVDSIDGIDKDIKFEFIIARNLITSTDQPIENTLAEAKKLLTENGQIILCETMPGMATRVSDFLHQSPLKSKLQKAEKKIYAQTDVFEKYLEDNFKTEKLLFTDTRHITPDLVSRWIKNTYAPALEMSETEAGEIEKELGVVLCKAPVVWKTCCILCVGEK